MPQIGLHFPSREIANTRKALAHWTDMARTSGAHYINLSDHILGVDPAQQVAGWDRNWMMPASTLTAFTHGDRWHEPLTAMSFMAARCELGFLSSVLVLPQRNTALVAKQATQLDILCDGRLRLGVGVGWNAAEFASIGTSFSDRGRRFEEQIALLRRFWTEDVVTFKGEFHEVRAAGIAPLPVQRPIPIWIGGANVAKGVAPVRRLLERIGALGDGWVTHTGTEPDGPTREAMNVIRTTAAAHGRDPRSVGLEVRISIRLIGRDKLAEKIAAWMDIGATHINIDASGWIDPGAANYAEQIHALTMEARQAGD